MRVLVEGIGLAGPGLDGWPAARPILAGVANYEPAPLRLQPPALLPPAERRRAGTTVKLAIAVGTEALAQAQREPSDMAMVFAASGADGDTVHAILAALATAQREVSPTRFHNSVHNAPSGYWSVATGSQAPSTSLSAFDDSFAAGLLEAAVQATVQDRPVTLVAYDMVYPAPLHAARPIVAAFGMALVLAPYSSERALASLSLEMIESESPPTTMADPQLERLRLGNPAARSLPLLAALARGDAAAIWLAGMRIAVAPA